MKNQYVFLVTLALGVACLFTQCTDEEELNLKAGTLALKLTDAASDDEEIKGIFISVAEVKLDGKPIRNFDPQKIEVSKLTNGQTRLLIEKKLPAKSYNQMSLVLSTRTTHPDNSPGCYVLTTNNEKHNLFADDSSAAFIEVPVEKAIEIVPGRENKIIVDFDLRKAIVRNNSEKNRYKFVTQPELKNAVRVVYQDTTGSITGKVKAIDLENIQYLVLAYWRGEFNAYIEGTGKGKSKVLFTNSVTSSKVAPDGSYYLPFVEEGAYEIRVAAFRPTRENGFVFNGFVRTTSMRAGTYQNNVSVSAGTETEVDLYVFSLY